MRRPLIALGSMLCILGVLSVGVVTAAQADDGGDATASTLNDLTLSLSPSNPSPGETVTLTLNSSYADLGQVMINWYEDGAPLDSGTGHASVSVTAGPYGSRHVIEADTEVNGGQESARAAIAPSRVDLLIDSESYVPPFYKGRALPSAGTTMRLLARADLRDASGNPIPSSNINYVWKRNGSALGSVSGVGKSSVSIPAPDLFGTDSIEVDAASVDGSASGVGSAAIPSVDPKIALYQDHPLYGITYYSGLGQATGISDQEMTFAAVPFFADASGPNDASLQYDWSVNGRSVAPNAQDPSEITVNAANSDGSAAIALSLSSARNLFLGADGTWQVTLGKAAASGSGAATAAGDPFHR